MGSESLGGSRDEESRVHGRHRADVAPGRDDPRAVVDGRSRGARTSANGQEQTCVRLMLDGFRPAVPGGSWPTGFTVSREQIHDEPGRLTGGPQVDVGEGFRVRVVAL